MAIVTMRILCNNALLLGLLLLLASTTAYQPSKAANTSRREHLVGLITTSVVAWTTASSPAVAVLGSGECASGVGEGCVDRSDGNAYIKSLQEKSAVTKDMYAQQARDAYYMKNYPDFFQTIGKTLVKKQDGTYMTVDDAELEALKQGNKLTVEIPKAMGGRVNDITQKPILILRE